MLVAAVLLGIANAVYHPADYSILGSVIDPPRLGRAFSIHTFAGFLGSALAPMTMLLMTHLLGHERRHHRRRLLGVARGGAADVRRLARHARRPRMSRRAGTRMSACAAC